MTSPSAAARNVRQLIPPSPARRGPARGHVDGTPIPVTNRDRSSGRLSVISAGRLAARVEEFGRIGVLAVTLNGVQQRYVAILNTPKSVQAYQC
jgi:hypothetical protein